ncbi:hypothetical protein FO519_007779 [Halicephalobus sp. NKZ332]|nr:hypothetical protein FO519_007779 [Halicephalobus sp. NKZ332]
MFSFSTQTSPYDEHVEKATEETLTSENWGLMMNICDHVHAEGSKGAKNVLLSIKKRLNNRDPHVVIYSLSLLDCLWKNAGAEVRKQISSKEFVAELNDKANSSVRAVAVKVREIVKGWAHNDCPKDPSLSLIASLYKELQNDGFLMDSPKLKSAPVSNDPNVVSSAEEEAALAKAIEASLKDAEQQKRKQSGKTTSAYPSLAKQALAGSSGKEKQFRQVKALYDFEEVEENELPFKAGDIITVLEDSDPNWWKGQSHRGVGLFPATFVTDKLDTMSTTNGTTKAEKTKLEPLPVRIDREILVKCLQMLEDCDPTGEAPDPPELAIYEEQTNKQAELIDKKLASIDKQMNMLANLDISVRNALAAYDEAIQQVQNQPPPPPLQPQFSFPDLKSGVFPTMPGGPMALLHQYQMAQGQGMQNQIGHIPQYGGMPFNQSNGIQHSQSNNQIPQYQQFQQGSAGFGSYPMQQGNQMNQMHQQGNQNQLNQIHQQGNQSPLNQIHQQGSFQQNPVQQQQNIAQQQNPVQHQQFVQNQPITSTVAPIVSQSMGNSQVTSGIPPIVSQNSQVPVIAPIVPQSANIQNQQYVQPQVSQDGNQLNQTVTQSEPPAVMNVAPVEPVVPVSQQQVGSQNCQQEPTQATVAPQRFTQVQQDENQSDVVEQQIVSLDDSNSEGERPVVDQQNADNVPVVNPIQIVPQQNQENQHFIAPVQPQVEQQ